VNVVGRLAVLAAALFLPLAVFSATTIVAFDHHERTDAEQLIHRATQGAVAVVHSFLAEQTASLEGLSTSFAAVEGEGERPNDDQLARMLANHPDWLAIAVFDTAGKEIAEAGQPPREAIRMAGNNPADVSSVRPAGQGLDEPYFLADYAVYHKQRFAHRIVAAVRAWPVTVALQREGVPPGWLVCVVDGKGHVVSLTKLAGPGGGVIGSPPTPSILAGLARPIGTMFSATMKGGEQVFAAAAAVPDIDWTLVVGAPRESIDGPRQHALWALGAGSLAAAGLGAVFFLGVFRAWTERSNLKLRLEAERENEALMRQAKERAESASAAKTRFLATASHDLRQPIQSLLLFAQALSTKLRGHEGQFLVEKMNVALSALKSMLDNLLDLSKIEAGLVEPELRTLELGPFLKQLYDTFEPRMAKAGLSFRYLHCSAWVQTDATLLAQIIGNLLDNALKYTQRGGVLLGCRKRGANVLIHVVDTGAGIDAKDIDVIFEEFVQVGEIGREHRQGLGLGLATVKGLTKLLGYRLRVSSRPGKGSIFTLEVPAAAPVLAAPTWQERGDALPRRILVIDDEAFILEGMRALLETLGHKVMSAASVGEARQVIETEGPPDIVLADYRLGPGVTGMQVIEELRASIGPVPAAIITGDTEVAKTVPRRAKVVVLHKPLGGDELRREIRRLVAQAR
jgi:signal transduction histidine kinase